MADPYQAVQSSENACGAFALACCICALEKQKFSGILNLRFSGNIDATHVDISRSVPIESGVDRTPHSDEALGTSLYGATGILNDGTTPPTYTSDGGQRNPPSALCWVATRFGLQPTVNVYETTWSLLSGKYCLEHPLLNANRTPVIKDQKAYILPAQSVQILLVGQSQEDPAHHWIARTQDGKYYDPADGKIQDAWSNPPSPISIGESGWSATTYFFSGLWIDFMS